MAKRSKQPRQPQRDDSPNIYEQFANELAKGGGIDRLVIFGKPTSPDPEDGEFDIDSRVQRCLVAIDEAEEGDKSKLVALMKSGSIPDDMVPHIGDLLDRCYHFKKPNHRPSTPSHRLTEKEIAMLADGGVKRRRGPERRIQARTYDAKRAKRRAAKRRAGRSRNKA